MEDETIHGERLTTWAVAEDGEWVQLGFADAAGRDRALRLPVELLSALMMTIPRMLRRALDTQGADGSLRITHPLGGWEVERAVGTDAAILHLATADGFEVTFAVAAPQADRLGAALRQAAVPDRAAVQALN